MNMSPGSVHRHTFKINYNKVLDHSFHASGVNDIEYYRGWTTFFMVVAHGYPVADSVGAVATGPVKLDYTYVFKYNLRTISHTVKYYNMDLNMAVGNVGTSYDYVADEDKYDNAFPTVS